MRAIVVVVVLGLAACGGGDDGDGEAATSSTTTTTEAPTTTTVLADPTEEITELFTTFFSPEMSDDERVALLEDPEPLRPLYDKARNDPGTGPILEQLSARVEKVTITSATTADVDYQLLVDGAPVTEGVLLGRAILIDGDWRVANSTLCSLLGLADPSVNNDPACAVG